MKIGFLSLPLTGHLNPMTALARKLKSRGHEVVFIGVPDIEPVVRAADLDFAPFCENEFPLGSLAKTWGGVANLHGLDVVRYTARELTPPLVRAALEHLPGKIAENGVNALVLDTAYRPLELFPCICVCLMFRFGISSTSTFPDRHHSLFTVGLMKRARKLSRGMSRDCR